MKCRILPVYNGQHAEPTTVVEVKLHRHTLEIEGLTETDAFELEEVLSKVTKIKIRRLGNDGKETRTGTTSR